MPSIGPISIPDPLTTGTFPLVTQYPHSRTQGPTVIAHLLGPAHANGKIEQRYVVGPGAKRFTVHKAPITPSDLAALWSFWQLNQGPVGKFTYHAPNEDGTTTDYVVRFANQTMSFDYMTSCLASGALELVEIVDLNPSYTVQGTATRLPAPTGGTLTGASVSVRTTYSSPVGTSASARVSQSITGLPIFWSLTQIAWSNRTDTYTYTGALDAYDFSTLYVELVIEGSLGWSGPPNAILDIFDCYLTLEYANGTSVLVRPTTVNSVAGTGRDTVSNLSVSPISGTINCQYTSPLSGPSVVTFAGFIIPTAP